MAQITYEFQACDDCVIAIANDDYTGMDDATEALVRAGIERLCAKHGYLVVTSNEPDEFVADACECCGQGAGPVGTIVPLREDTTMNATQFFYENAGYSYNPQTETQEAGRKRCAEQLAEAERHAKTADWYYEWVPDGDADPFDWDGEGPMGSEAYGCVLHDAENKVLASLWGIWDPDANYRRVVEAELASECAVLA